MRPRRTASSSVSWSRSRVITITSSGFRTLRDVLSSDSFLTGGMAAGTYPSCPVRRNEQLEQRLLRVAAVLGLVPDPLARAVEHGLGDLLARMGGQAVQREGVRRRPCRAARRRSRTARAPRGGRRRSPRSRSSRPRRRCRRRRRPRRPRPGRRRARPASRPRAAGSRPAPRHAPRHPPAHRRSPASGRRCCRRRRRRARGPRASRAPRASSADRRAPGTGGAAARACSRPEQWHARRAPVSSSSSPVRSPITAAWREST